MSSEAQIRSGRLGQYLFVAFLAGGAAQQQWTNFLNAYWFGVATTSALLVLWLVILGLMYRRDYRRSRMEEVDTLHAVEHD